MPISAPTPALTKDRPPSRRLPARRWPALVLMLVAAAAWSAACSTGSGTQSGPGRAPVASLAGHGGPPAAAAQIPSVAQSDEDLGNLSRCIRAHGGCTGGGAGAGGLSLALRAFGGAPAAGGGVGRGAVGGAGAAPAAAAPPPPSTATVVRTDLATTVLTEGTLGYAPALPIVNQIAGTYTWLPAVGSRIRAGRALYRVDNLPIVLMRVGTPAWPPFVLGMTDGPDVRELQANLIALQYATGLFSAPTGTFDWPTAQAVERA